MTAFRVPMVLLALLAVAACDSGPNGEPGSTYPFAGSHPLIRLSEIPEIRPTAVPNLSRNVEVIVASVDPCPPADQVTGACVTNTITLVEDPSASNGFVLPADLPSQFEVGARYRITLLFFAGDDSIAVYLRGYTRI